MTEVNTKPTTIPIEAFLSGIHDEQMRSDSNALIKLMNDLTGEPATMWGPDIVGFGKYHYKYESGREGVICLTGFSPRKGKLSLYVLAGFDGQQEVLLRLGKYKTGKGCLYIEKLADININVLKEIILKSIATLKERYN